MSPDGATVFASEAGVLAVIDPIVSMETPTKVESISSQGVRAVEMVLDPDADLTENPKENNLLYIAGGRMGLWVMQADPRPGVSLAAARIDDAVAPGDQSSRRWVNDVDFMTMEGTTYLLALFAAKDDTRLRVYPLSSARSVLTANPGAETGHEIWPILEAVCNPAHG